MKEPPDHFPPLLDAPASPLGTVIVLNGLNTRPSALNQLANEIVALGWRVRMVTLERKNSLSPKDAIHDAWLESMQAEISAGQRELPEQPVVLLGYSLGAMLSLDYYFQNREKVAGLFLLAPPVTLHWPQRLMLRLSSWSPFDLAIPSAAEPAYRLRDSTMLSDYAVLQSAIDAVNERAVEGALGGVPLCVIASAFDEFVPLVSLQDWFLRTAPGVTPVVVSKRARSGRGMAHQIIDQASLGPSDWDVLKASLRKLLERVASAQI